MPVKKLMLSMVALAALICALPTAAAEVTPESYKEAVEPICKTNTEANEKILKGVRQKVKEGKLDAAARQVAAAARALKRTWRQLSGVPKPAEDAKLLTRWLGYVKTEIELFERLSKKLANGEKTGAQKMVVRLTSTANRANNLVIKYEFRYCRFRPSKFL
jgi:hypothetical protein